MGTQWLPFYTVYLLQAIRGGREILSNVVDHTSVAA
jgi:hypothetical protein